MCVLYIYVHMYIYNVFIYIYVYIYIHVKCLLYIIHCGEFQTPLKMTSPFLKVSENGGYVCGY